MSDNQPLLSLHTWVSLPNEVRQRIRNHFQIPQSSHVMVSDGVLETDGTTPEDFKHLSISKMQEYTGNESTDFHVQFGLVVDKINEEISPTPVTAPVIQPVAEIISEPVAPKPKKNAKKNKQV